MPQAAAHRRPCLLFLLAAAALATPAFSQPAPASWQACAAVANAADRLACFDRWAEAQRAAPVVPAAPATVAPAAPATPATTATAGPPPAAPQAVPPPVTTGPWRDLRLTELEGCHDTNYSALSRYWELEPGADCGTFGIRGYRPITLALVTADTVNRQPTSGNPVNNAPAPVDYRNTETRLQLSVRTKVASGLLPWKPGGSDSLWFGYTQQSYWQLFTPALSRPFRSTDHEPELVYVVPVQSAAEGRWRLRYAGLGLVHQSNGQSLPYSRSWNRAYLMAGAERGPLQLHARAWRRLSEQAGSDDNPGIGSYVGRAELRGTWQVNRRHQLAATLRHTLDDSGRGSVRLEWFRTLGDAAGAGGLQLHTQLFTGWGDSLLDYNRKRTVFSVGLSLVEW